MAQLTEHFREAELGVQDAEQRIIENATKLCLYILEPIHRYYNRPVIIHDGYRDPAHNERVHGVLNSWHLYKDTQSAADFSVDGVILNEVFDWMRRESKLPFDKVILERDKSGAPRCIHVQFDWVQPNRRRAFVGSTYGQGAYVEVDVSA